MEAKPPSPLMGEGRGEGETETSRVFIWSFRMNIGEFSSWKRGIFRRGKEVK